MLSPRDLLRQKPYLAWSVADPATLSDEVILEQILNYGDWTDVQAVIASWGWDKTAALFETTSRKERCNYRPEVKYYFQRYFACHAPRNF